MKSYTKIAVILIILVCVCLMLIGLWETLMYGQDPQGQKRINKRFKQRLADYEEKEDTKYGEVKRSMSKNRRERNLARQHGKNLKAIFDYVDR